MAKRLRVIDTARGRVADLQVEVVNGDGTYAVAALASSAETRAGTSDELAVTPKALTEMGASISAVGVVELATAAEAKAQTDATRAIPPSALRQDAPAIAEGSLAAMFAQHYQVAPDAASATAVHAAMNLGADVQEIATGITSPDVPRTLTVKGSASGISGNVVIHGTNIAGDAISDIIALNGATEVEGVKAFLTTSQIDLPVESHAHAAQVETVVAVGTVTADPGGTATVTVTAAGMTGSGTPIDVPLLLNDDAAAIGGKIRAALQATAGVTAMFAVSGDGANVILTRLVPAENDATLNIAIATGTATGVTAVPSSTDTTAGVAYDTVSVGMANKLGMPHILDNAAMLLIKLFNGSTDSGSLAVDADEIEKNLFALNGTPDGAKLVDLVYLV